MLYPGLLAVHIFCAILWGGGGVAAAFFFLPLVLRGIYGADPLGAGVDGCVAQQRFGRWMGLFSALALLSGLGLVVLRARSMPAWFGSVDGIVLDLGILIGLGAFAIGTFVLRPRAARIHALALEVRAAGVAPAAERLESWAAQQARLVRSAQVAAWHLIFAALLMTGHGLVAILAR